tara:strand:+ start:91 stop:324 length:234 start_codon:yes stop_codon:yes gene_type:complete
MLIPVKCFTCGNVLANKYQYYLREVRKRKLDKGLEINTVKYLTQENNEKTAEGEVMDILNLHKYCCRRHMLTHVDID